jgi:cytochrome c-type biogenesis protein CcmH
MLVRLALVVLLAACASRRPELAAAEQDLQARLMAPCHCPQTLDIHASPSATELRAEIHNRLVNGEDPEAIYNDIVGRYGDWIRAGESPLKGLVGPIVALFGVLAIGGVVFTARRWVRRSQTDAPAGEATASKTPDPAVAKDKDEWNARLDDELDEVE